MNSMRQRIRLFNAFVMMIWFCYSNNWDNFLNYFNNIFLPFLLFLLLSAIFFFPKVLNSLKMGYTNTHWHTTNAICWFPSEKLVALTHLYINKNIFCFINCDSLRWARCRHLKTAIDTCQCVPCLCFDDKLHQQLG